MKKIVIMMATYNRGDIIDKSVASIKAQTYKNWHLLIANNGKDDCSRFEEDPQITVIDCSAETGESYARNESIKYVKRVMKHKGLACFFDDDDIMYPEHLETFARVFRNEKVRMARCGMRYVRNGKENYTFATPLVMTYTVYMKPTWLKGEKLHDQMFWKGIASQYNLTIANKRMVLIKKPLMDIIMGLPGGLRDGVL